MNTLKFVDVGEGITEGHVRKWLVGDGSIVKEDQPLLQIETDKAIVNLPAPVDGKVKFAAKEDSVVHVGDALAYVGSPEELRNIPEQGAAQPVQTQAAQQTAAPATPAAAATPSTQPKEVMATPSVRHLARELGVDLSKIVGTGPGGRIVENDVRGTTSKPQQSVPATKFSETLEAQHGEEVERVPLSMTRKAIARNMEMSLSVPSAAHMDLINASSLYSIVKKAKPNAEKMSVKLTFLPFIIKAVIEAIKESPRFNSSYDRDKQEVIIKKYYNIGIAAQTQDGLKVVVVKNANQKSIMTIAKELQDFREKLDKQTITLEEMRDSTFTITNIGSLGGGFLSVPIINPPEVAILGVHLIRDMPVVDNGQVQIGKVLPFSLVFDHRVVDGADAALFGNTLIKYLEDPEFLEMLG